MKSLKITSKITTRESEAFNRYLKEVSVIEPFESAEDEYECAVRAFNGDNGAREELIKRNLRFVISAAKQYQIKGVSLEDLVNEGNIGIARAAKRYDPTMGNKFISYAVWWIRKELINFLSTHSRTIKLPTNKVGAVSKFKSRITDLEQRLQRVVTKTDVIEAYDDYTCDDVELLFELSNSDVTSLDMKMGNDEDSSTLHEVLSDDSFGRADELVMKSDMEVNINRLFTVLKPNEMEIITMLYGLNGDSPRTLEDVGNHFKISRESVRQRRDKAFTKIKGKFNHTAKHMINH